MKSKESITEAVYETKSVNAAQMPVGLLGRGRRLFRDMALSVLSSVNPYMEKSFVRCLYCHNVFDDEVESFERLLCSLKNYGDFVDTPTLLAMASGDAKIDGRYYHLSFDDGFRNNYTNALPVLNRQKVPCLFFVPSALIGAGWEAAKSYSLETTRYNGVIELLRWPDIADMVASGYEIGSHTRTHACFSTISHDASLLEEEILGSKLDLERHLGIPCRYISWPFGTRTDADTRSLRAAVDAGYDACFGAFRGSVVPGRTDLFSIPRHHFEPSWPLSHVRYFARGNMERQ